MNKKLAISLVGLMVVACVDAYATDWDIHTGSDTAKIVGSGTGNATLTVDAVTATTITPTTLTATTATVAGKTPIVSASATVISMIQSGTTVASAQTLLTNTFAVVFASAPVVTCTYASDPGDVAPVYISSVASNEVVFKAAVTNVPVSYIAVGVK